jgi:hypothetical protein
MALLSPKSASLATMPDSALALLETSTLRAFCNDKSFGRHESVV